MLCFDFSSLHLFSENVESKYLKSEKPKKLNQYLQSKKQQILGKKVIYKTTMSDNVCKCISSVFCIPLKLVIILKVWVNDNKLQKYKILLNKVDKI